MPIGKVPLSKKEQQIADQIKQINKFIEQIETKYDKLTTESKRAVMMDIKDRKDSSFGFMISTKKTSKKQ